MREQFQRAPYNYFIKKLNICSIPLRYFVNSSDVFLNLNLTVENNKKSAMIL